MAGATVIHKFISASPEQVYTTILNAAAVAKWMVPEGMTSHVHHFEPYEGGTFRITLTYQTETSSGKTTSQTDTHHGRFVELVPHKLIVEVVEFESVDPEMLGEMTIRYHLEEHGSGTMLLAEHEHLPPGISPEDNEIGWTMALDQLADLLESNQAN